MASVFSNDDPVDLDLVYAKVIFGHLGFCMGKAKTMDSSETIAACDMKNGRCSQLNEFSYKYQRSRSFLNLVPKLLKFQN